MPDYESNPPTSSLSGPRTDPRPVAPEEPGPNECCGSGCPLCVLDLYSDELQRYRQALAAWRLRNPDQAP